MIEIEESGGKGAINPYAYAFEGESGAKKVKFYDLKFCYY